MKRTYIFDIKSGKKVLLKGWVHEIRNLSNLKFVLLRDRTGMVQCVAKSDKVKEAVSNLTLEDVVEVKGRVKKAKIKAEHALKNVEIEISNIKVLNKSDKLPIHVNEKSVKAGLDKRLDYRYLDLRKPKVKAIFKIQSVIINSFREFFHRKGFVEIQPPALIATSTEGGTDLFEADYFGRKAYLAQSPQLYKQLGAISLEKVFSTSAVWRAEKHDTSKHINEIRQMDIEVAFVDDMKIMRYLEQVIKHIAERVLKECKSELDVLGVKLKVPKIKYMTYGEAIKLLNKHGFKLKTGDDFEPEAERKLAELFPDTVVFTCEWPIKIKPFYIWPKNPETGVSGGFDAVYGGLEVSSGGQRVHVPEILISQLKEKKLEPKDFKWYVDAFRYGAPEHSGWSIGLERLTQAMLGLENIREATMFPRDRKRLTP